MLRTVVENRLAPRIILVLCVTGGAALLTGCSGTSARSDYYTLRGFFVQPSASPSTFAAAPTD